MMGAVVQPTTGLYSRWNRPRAAHTSPSRRAPCRRALVRTWAHAQASQEGRQQVGSAGLPQKLGLAAAGLLGAGLLVCSSAGATEALAECAATPQVVDQLSAPVAELLAPAQECLRNGLEWVVQESVTATNLAESNFASVGPGGMWLANTPFCDVWDAYCTVLNERPLFTKIMTGMLGTLLGDLLAQCLANLPPAAAASEPMSDTSKEQGGRGPQKGNPTSGGMLKPGKGFQYDGARTLRLLAYSALVGTPVAHWWFGLLDAWVFPEAPTSLPGVLSKMALDQALMAPLMTATFFALMKALEGRPGEATGEVSSKLLPTLRANWAVWPAAHLVNFALVPAQQRILYINLISIAWTAYMSHMASGEEAERDTSACARPQSQSAAPGANPSTSHTLKRAFSSSRLTR